jgi:endonuclease YncB( thermonuclease family)
MRSPVRLVVAATAVATGLTLFAGVTPAEAQTLQYWTATITKVADGDTVYADVVGDGKAGVPIRNLNIQAMEMDDGVGGGPECNATQASARMKELLPVGTKVRLAAYSESSTQGTDGAGVTRLLRYVDKYNSATGNYDYDVQSDLIRRGLALAGSNKPEDARAESYAYEMQKAMKARLGIFNSNVCGGGPSPGARLPMWIQYRQENGSDANLEWIRIRNLSSFDVPLGGWRIRDAGHSWYHGTTYYMFASNAVLRRNSTITLHAGAGTDNVATGNYYLDAASTGLFPEPQILSNPTPAYPGRVMYLVDPQLDFRAWAIYACVYQCAKPAVHIKTIHNVGPEEYVDIVVNNGVSAGVDLTGVALDISYWTEELAPGTVLYPGETLRVWVSRTGHDYRRLQYWHVAGAKMRYLAGTPVLLRTAQATVVHLARWDPP